MLDRTVRYYATVAMNIIEKPLEDKSKQNERIGVLQGWSKLFKQEEQAGHRYIRFTALKMERNYDVADTLHRKLYGRTVDGDHPIGNTPAKTDFIPGVFKPVTKFESFFENFWRAIGWPSGDIIEVSEAKELVQEKFYDFKIIDKAADENINQIASKIQNRRIDEDEDSI